MQEDGQTTRKSEQVRIKLREDLRCSLHQHGGAPCYVVEDPVAAKFFRLGVREWTFVSFLDGRNSVRDARDLAGEALGPRQLSRDEVRRLCRWLIQSRLAYLDTVDVDELQSPAAVAAAADRPGGVRFNPFFIRIPLLNPDRPLTAVAPWLGWTLQFHAFLVWVFVCTAGAYRIWTDWDRFAAASAGLLSPHNWLMLLAVWVLLKVVHELAHGLACKRFGGTVPRAGVILILFSPVAYVDLTSCWRIRSKWRRIFTSAAGMYLELGLAGAAALVWSYSRPGIVSHLSHKVVLMAGLTTVLFNLNPLMRFDGYYIAGDLLGITNLYQRGRAYVRYCARRYLLGMRSASPEPASAAGMLIRCYGFAALIWRTLVCIALAAAAATLLGGLGLVLTLLGITVWIALPAVRLVRFLASGTAAGGPRLSGVAVRALPAGAIAAGVLMLPWPGGVSAPAIVEYAPLSVVRAEVPGFVTEVRVAGGDAVEAGRVLAVISNHQEQLALEELELQIRQSALKSRALQTENEIAKCQVERENLQTLQAKRTELQQRLEGLLVRAPAAGRVIGRNLDSMLGQYVAAGTQLMAIGTEDRKELLASVAQEDVDSFQDRIGSPVEARVHGRRYWLHGARLQGLSPAASRLLEHPALGARCGGPLAVTLAADDDDVRQTSSAPCRLIRPRVGARISISAEAAAGLRAGEPATVALHDSRQSIGGYLYRHLDQWLRRRVAARSGAGD